MKSKNRLSKKEIKEFASLVDIRVNSEVFGMSDLRREEFLESKMSEKQHDNYEQYMDGIDFIQSEGEDVGPSIKGIIRALLKK